MPDKPGIAIDYRVALADEIRSVEHKLGRGDAKTFDEYLARCAEIRAYQRALSLFASTLERYLETDELDEVST